MIVREGARAEINPVLEREHYLGPLASARLILVGEVDGEVVAGQVWKWPTARGLPSTGAWLELSRWVLTSAAGYNSGSRFHAAAMRYLRDNRPETTTLVSYSDPDVGHTGALYRACNWVWCPTWQRLRPPPTRGGDWGNGKGRSSVKDRWIFPLNRDDDRDEMLRINDRGAIRAWAREASIEEVERASRSLAPDLADYAKWLLS